MTVYECGACGETFTAIRDASVHQFNADHPVDNSVARQAVAQ